jgi:hypothetical protein
MQEEPMTGSTENVSGKAPEPGDPAEMSEAATLGNIFFEPGRTFEDLRRKPRWILAGLVIIIAISAFNFLFIQKLGYESIVKARIESNESVQKMPADQRQQIIDQQSGGVWKVIGYVAPAIVMVVIFLLGGLIYFLGANAMGGSAGFFHGVSVWVYSWLPPFVVSILANLVVLLIKSAEEIDIVASQSGLVQANPSFFIDTKAMPVLAAILSTFDLFAIWGWILAAIGLQKVGRISSGAAWAIVLMLGLAGVAAKVVAALVFG